MTPLKTLLFFSFILIIQHSSSASILSWFTGGSTTEGVIPPETTLSSENGKAVNQRSQVQFPEESGECSHWGNVALPPIDAHDTYFDIRPPFPGDLVGAHSRLPIGTIVTVTNMKNGNTVRVRVVPPKSRPVFGRIMDLSPTAFAQLENVREGIFTCTVRVVQVPRQTEVHSLTSHTFDDGLKSSPTAFVSRDVHGVGNVDGLGLFRKESGDNYKPQYTDNYY